VALEFSSVSCPSGGDGDYSVLRETFNNNLAIMSWDPEKFRIIPLSGGVEPKIEQIVMPDGIGDSLDLTISVMTGEAGKNSYKAWIESGYLQEIRAGRLDAPNNEFLFVGECSPFRIAEIQALNLTEVKVKFNRQMMINSDLIDPSQYVFDNGLVCIGVEVAGVDSIILHTTPQNPKMNYQLSI